MTLVPLLEGWSMAKDTVTWFALAGTCVAMMDKREVLISVRSIQPCLWLRMFPDHVIGKLCNTSEMLHSHPTYPRLDPWTCIRNLSKQMPTALLSFGPYQLLNCLQRSHRC
jgi:hypothetical protein